MKNFIESLKKYSSSKGYEQVEQEGFDLVLQKQVDNHVFKISVSKEPTSKGIFSLEILNSEQKVEASVNMRTAEFFDFNDHIDLSFDILYNGIINNTGL